MNVTDNLLLMMQNFTSQSTTQTLQSTNTKTHEHKSFDKALQQQAGKKAVTDRSAPASAASDMDEATLSASAQQANAALAAQAVEIIPVEVVLQENSVVTVSAAAQVLPEAASALAQDAPLVEQAPEQAQPTGDQPPQVSPEAPSVTTQAAPVEAAQQTSPNSVTKSAADGDSPIEQIELKQPEEAPSQPLFRELEGSPVKVGEAPQADATAPDFEQQLAKQIDTALAQGEQRLAIKLAPEHLGTLTLELTRAQDGSLRVVLQASTEKAATLLSEHAAGLGSLLRGSVQVPVQVEVQQHNQQQKDPSSQNHSQSQQQQQHQDEQTQPEDFLQQLRLGIVPMWDEAG